MTDETKVPAGWPPGYGYYFDSISHDRCGYRREENESPVRFFTRWSMSPGASVGVTEMPYYEACRRDAWAHYATTREAALDEALRGLEQERNEYRDGAALSQEYADRWLRRVGELTRAFVELHNDLASLERESGAAHYATVRQRLEMVMASVGVEVPND